MNKIKEEHSQVKDYLEINGWSIPDYISHPNITIKHMAGIVDYIAKNWEFNGRYGIWDSKELNKNYEPVMSIYTTEILIQEYIKQL